MIHMLTVVVILQGKAASKKRGSLRRAVMTSSQHKWQILVGSRWKSVKEFEFWDVLGIVFDGSNSDVFFASFFCRFPKSVSLIFGKVRL